MLTCLESCHRQVQYCSVVTGMNTLSSWLALHSIIVSSWYTTPVAPLVAVGFGLSGYASKSSTHLRCDILKPHFVRLRACVLGWFMLNVVTFMQFLCRSQRHSLRADCGISQVL